MMNFKKLALVMSLITILCILIWYDKSSSIDGSRGLKPQNKVITSETSPTKISTIVEENPIALERLKLRLPSNWVKKGDAMQIDFLDISKKIVGGIQLLGYYGEQPGGCLPNHSDIVSSEEVNTSLGKGKLYVLSRSNSAASLDTKTWFEIHAVIPIINKERAYDFWIMGKNKYALLNILKGIN